MKMKRILASLLCLVMVLAMALTMTACEKDKKSKKDEDGIVGEWEWAGTSFSQTGLLDGVVGEMEELADYIDFGDVSMGLNFNFKSNGKVVMTFADVDKTMDDLADALMDAFKAYVEDNGYTFEEGLEMMGYTESELKKEIKDMVEDGLAGLEDIEETCYYELDGEDILTGDDKDDLTKEGTYEGNKIVLEVEGETLTLIRAE